MRSITSPAIALPIALPTVLLMKYNPVANPKRSGDTELMR